MAIVLYEEDLLTRSLLQEWLHREGFEVRDGRLRDSRLDRSAELVVVSVHLPKQTGAQCVAVIRAAHPDTPILAISGQFRCGLSSGGDTARTLGVQQVVAKPLERGAFLDAVRAIIGSPA